MKKVLTFGVYDMLHIGHVLLFMKARELGDKLIVAVQDEEVILKYKPGTKMIYTTEERLFMVSSIKYVDEVVPQTTMDKMEFLKHRHFDVMFHGDEWKGTELYNKYEQEFAQYGARIEYLSHTDGISSTMLRERINKK